jgi:hypothetical protein
VSKCPKVIVFRHISLKCGSFASLTQPIRIYSIKTTLGNASAKSESAYYFRMSNMSVFRFSLLLLSKKKIFLTVDKRLSKMRKRIKIIIADIEHLLNKD